MRQQGDAGTCRSLTLLSQRGNLQPVTARMTTTRQDGSHKRFFGRTVPRSFEVVGLANVASWVTVNGDAAYRKGEYYRKEVSVSTGNNAAYTVVTSRATVAGSDETQVGSNFTPAATETFVHDGDGNLTQDGLWDYAWDGENRLIRMTTRTDVTVAPVRRIEFEYDWLGRRIGKVVYNARSGGTLLSTARFLYDGWNLLAELDGSNNRVRTYMWGLDLSGSAQGAGGVGGLLKVTCYGPTTTNAFVAYDGNGNVMGLLDAATITWVARYEYGPFGEVIRMTGTMAKANPFRFSTKYQDDESDLIYYGYRYYNPSSGRWISRDPIGERGGCNLYGFAGNDPLDDADTDGRFAARKCPVCGQWEQNNHQCPGPPPPPLPPGPGKPPSKKPPSKPGTPQHPGGGQCPKNPPSSNGCGPSGWKGRLVPNMPFRFVDFKPACDNHDVCYGTCGKEKARCDEDFLGDMAEACADKYAWLSIDPIPPKQAAKQVFCMSLAQTYYEAVSAGGAAPYEAGQKQGCKCYCEKKEKR